MQVLRVKNKGISWLIGAIFIYDNTFDGRHVQCCLDIR